MRTGVEVSEEEKGLEDDRLAHSLVLFVEDEYVRVATLLAEAITKLAKAETKLREAVDGAVWRKFFGRHYNH